MPARPKYRARKSPRERLRLALGLILFFVLCSLFYVLFASWQKRLWIPGTRMTVVVAGQAPTVYSYDPQTGKIIYFVIPRDTQLQTARYGNWLAQSLWDLGHQEKMEGNLLRLSVQKSLGIPVDAWVSPGGETLFENHPLGMVFAFWKALFLKDIKTSLTYFDRVSLLAKTSAVGVADRQKVDLLSLRVIEKTQFPDGVSGYLIVPEQAKVGLNSLRDDLVAGEAKRVEVVNASGKSGLAQEVAAVVSTLGTRVVGIKTDDLASGECEIQGTRRNLESLSARRIAAILGCRTQEESNSQIVDLEVILKEGFAQKF